MSTASGTVSHVTTFTTSAAPNHGPKPVAITPHSLPFLLPGNGNAPPVPSDANSREQDVGVRSILSAFLDLCQMIDRMRVLILATEQIFVLMVRRSLV
jgi:hypothetical protein